MSLSGSTNQPANRTGDGALMYDQATGPEPTAENPGGAITGFDLSLSELYLILKVFPQIDPRDMPARGGMPGAGAPDHGGDARGVFSNPLMFKDTFQELSSAFTKAIHAVEDESRSGVGSVGKALVDALKERRAEIDGWLQGKNVPGAEGGEKNDDVTRKEDKATGLYAD